jgi:hypothetical protein
LLPLWQIFADLSKFSLSDGLENEAAEWRIKSMHMLQEAAATLDDEAQRKSLLTTPQALWVLGNN